MKSAIQQLILDDITTFYLKSRDFNGLPVVKLKAQHDLDDDKLRLYLHALIGQEEIALVFGDVHPNPHIRAFPDEPKEDQGRKLGSPLMASACVYPTQGHLASVVDPADYTGRPYTLALALGEPQLAFKAFNLSVLEFYRNDPRYYYTTNDVHGCITYVDEYGQSGSLATQEQIVLQHFGFCYNDDLDRAVAVIISYLADLTPEHQQMWKLRELSGSHFLHPGYINLLRGEWPESISMFEAFIQELEVVNQMCALIHSPPLFRQTFVGDRPRQFGFLIRPTLTEFNDFVQLLDKMMSDNINKEFFAGEVREEAHPKGTVTLLAEWLNQKFKPEDPEPLKDTIKAFREVRQKRQKPAHAVIPNSFDQKYIHEQRELMIRAYTAVRTIRLILANALLVRLANLKINEPIYEGNIWTY